MMILLVGIMEVNGSVTFEIKNGKAPTPLTALERKAAHAVCDAIAAIPDVTGKGVVRKVKDERDLSIPSDN